MGAPIIVNQRRNPWEGLLMNMYLTKFSHNLTKERQQERREDIKLNLEEQRSYDTKQKGLATKAKYQEQGRSFISDTEKAGVLVGKEGVVQNPYTGGLWSKKPPQQIIDVGGGMVGVYDQASGEIDLHNKPQYGIDNKFDLFLASELEKDPKASPNKIYKDYQQSETQQKKDVATATEMAKQNAAMNIGKIVVKNNKLGERLAKGITSPDDISQSFRQPYVRILAVAEARKLNPNYNEIEAVANSKWFKSPTTQRLIRRTESIVEPNGAADEAIRFARLVKNPAGTPINMLKGKVQVMFGNSKRALLNLVHGIHAEELQQIMGAQGGGEKFLEFTKNLNNPDLSVKQYVNTVNELKHLIVIRQVANTKGTPVQEKWQKILKHTEKIRPFANDKKVIESRRASDGRIINKYSDGTLGYE